MLISNRGDESSAYGQVHFAASRTNPSECSHHLESPTASIALRARHSEQITYHEQLRVSQPMEVGKELENHGPRGIAYLLRC